MQRSWGRNKLGIPRSREEASGDRDWGWGAGAPPGGLFGRGEKLRSDTKHFLDTLLTGE